jgi:hypothetical protein
MSDYAAFLEAKSRLNDPAGFEPIFRPDFLYDFQRTLTEWAIRTGRAALLQDCGTGKTPEELVWAENIIRKTNKPILILTPLAVAEQFVREGVKFGIEVTHARDGKIKPGINVVNYQRLGYFHPADFAGLVCDESGVLKHHDAKTRKAVTAFASKMPYILLGTATPAPNDFMELGNSAEVLRVMPYYHMLSVFFSHDDKTGNATRAKHQKTSQWRLKGHAKRRFWRWVSSWARAIRKPSDLGFEDKGFTLSPLNVIQHTLPSPNTPGMFWAEEAKTLKEQRAERRRTLKERCEKVASLVPADRPFIAWCHLNVEGDLMTKLIPDAVQVAGSEDDEIKEDKLAAFGRGDIRVLVTKPTIAGFGLNWQHCSDISFFPAHSFEQFYQAVRRCWRFGQTRTVNLHIVTSEAESRVLENLRRKEREANDLYDGLIREMSEFQLPKSQTSQQSLDPVQVPAWL